MDGDKIHRGGVAVTWQPYEGDSDGAKAIRFIERLRNPEGSEWSGKPLRLLNWQKRFIIRLYDTLTPDHKPQYEHAFLFLPKKQGKTVFAAAMALERMVRKPHSQIKCLGQVKDQAALCYKFIASMIRQDDALSQRKNCRVYKGNSRIVECYFSDSTLQVLSSDAVGANGLNGNFIIHDEICFSQYSDLHDAVISGGINRDSFMDIGISTAGMSTAFWGYQYYELAKSILKDPSIDPTFLPVIYEAPMNADWTDPQTYLKCSPTFAEQGGPAIRRIQGMIDAAKRDPAKLRMLRRYQLNQWIGSDAGETWIPLDKWDACCGTMKESDLDGKECYIGLDLAAVKDTTSKVELFPLENGYVAIRLRVYMPADNIADRERTDPGAFYTEWIKRGLMKATPGAVTDYDFIRGDVQESAKTYSVLGVGSDPWNASQLLKDMEGDGHDVVQVRQGLVTMSPAAKAFERLVYSGKLIHFGNPILRWMISNSVAKVCDSAGNIKITKSHHGARIDGVYAALDALALYLANDSAECMAGIAVG